MKFDFIEIGTSDFETMIESSVSGIGMSIEPLKFYLDNLPDKDNVIKLNCAVSDRNGEVDIFWINPSDIDKYGLPQWLRGCNSIINPHPSALTELAERKLEHIYKKSKCKCMTWDSIVETYDIKHVEYLKIDTEGHDTVIINRILDYDKILPKSIFFENNALSNESDVNRTLARLANHGYKVVERQSDSILVERT